MKMVEYFVQDNFDRFWEEEGRDMMAKQMKIEGDVSKMSKARLRQHEIKQKMVYEKILLERADDIVGKHVYRLKEKKLSYLRMVCDPTAEYE